MNNAYDKGTRDESSAGETRTSSGEIALNRAFQYLFSLQKSDGGWGAPQDGPSSIHMTAMAMISLRRGPGGNEKGVTVSRAAGYLLSRQHADGGFGDVFSTVHETALACHALEDLLDDPEVLYRARRYLILSQMENGSWNDDLYSTALALEACVPSGEGFKAPAAGDGEPGADGTGGNPRPDDPGGARPASDEILETNQGGAATVGACKAGVAVVRSQIREPNERNKISLVSRRKASASSSSEPPTDTVAASKSVIVKSVSTDRKKYGANETVHIHSTIENRSEADFSVVVNAQLADAHGHIVDVATHETGPAVKLSAGGSEPVTLLWNTGLSQPGAYSVRFHIADAASGTVVDERKMALAISPSVDVDDVDLVVTPLNLNQDETKTVELSLKLQNRSNTDAVMSAEFFVKDPEGTVVHEGCVGFELSPSTPEKVLVLPPLTHSFVRCGQYLVGVSILSGDVRCGEARKTIRVAPATRIEVVKTLYPAAVTPDGDKKIRVGIRLEGVGATVNPSFLSAMTNTGGDRITIVFDKAMAAPAAGASPFTVVVDRTLCSVTDVRVKESDITRMDLSLATAVTKDQTVLVSYAGPDLTCLEGKPVMPFHDEPVVNKVSPPIFNQDGYGSSGPIPPNPLAPETVMTGHDQWPRGFYKNVLAFAGAVFDGQDIWMVPANADSVVRVDSRTGEMTAYNQWPEGFSKGGHAFAGGTFDGKCLWMVPSYADSVVKLDTVSGEMTRYNAWPEGFSKGGYAFAGCVYDGRHIWMVPANADSVVKLDTVSGEMTKYNEWPAGLGKVEYAFAGGAFDGRYVWLVPYYADRVVRIDRESGEMTGHHPRPEGLGKVEYAFAGAVFDGQGIWMVPLNADRVVRIDKDTAEATEYPGWPRGFIKGVNAFAGGVFDGESIWMIPSYADRMVRISSFSSLSVSAAITASDAFWVYVSQDESEEGRLAGQGKGWSSVHSLNAALVPGLTNYLHVKCVDTVGPVAAFMADLILNDGSFHFADGSRHLVTAEGNWRVYTDRFGGAEGLVTAVCRNGGGSWSTRFGIDLDANWIWTCRGVDKGSRLFSTPIYYSPVPVAPMKDVHITDTIADANITVDTDSFTREPSRVEQGKDGTIVEWRLEEFRVGQREDLFFNVMLRDTTPGEDLLVNHSLEMLYKDAGGQTAHKELGPCHVHVLRSPFACVINTGQRIYRMGDDVAILCSIRNLSDLHKTLDVRVMLEDIQGVLIEEALIKDVRCGPGEDKNIDGIVFKLVATNAGAHRARMVLHEGGQETDLASVDLMVEDVPPQSMSLQHGDPPGDGRVQDGSTEGGGSPAAGRDDHDARLTDEVDRPEMEDLFAGGTDGLEGTISAQPSPIFQGLSETIYYTVSKGAGRDLTGLSVIVVIADQRTGETRQSFSAPRSHLKSGSFAGSFTFSTGILEPGEYAARLQVSPGSGSEPQEIAATSFVIRSIEVVLT